MSLFTKDIINIYDSLDMGRRPKLSDLEEEVVSNYSGRRQESYIPMLKYDI